MGINEVHLKFLKKTIFFKVGPLILPLSAMMEIKRLYTQRLFLEINTFMQQKCIKLIENDSKDIYN